MFLKALREDDEGIQNLRERLLKFAESQKEFQIIIMASLDGGTGSGLAYDVTHTLKSWCQSGDARRRPQTVGVFFAGHIDDNSAARVAAAIDELERLQSVRGISASLPQVSVTAGWDGTMIDSETPLFDRCYVLDRKRPLLYAEFVPSPTPRIE